MIEWDERKRRTNLANHGVDFADFERFDWSSHVSKEDLRHDYGERRERILGLIGERLHVAIITRRATGLRLISLRKANRREVMEWAESN